MDEALGGRGVKAYRARFFVLFCVLLSAVALGAGCKRRAGAKVGDDAPQATFVVKDASEGLLLTWIDERGDFHVEQNVTDVPLVGRDSVRVVDPAREDGTHGDKVFVADLRVAGADGTFPVRTMTRAEFDALAIARRQKAPTAANAANEPEPPSAPRRHADPSPGAVDPSPSGRPAVIIYGASWCGACHDAAAYLRRKGIPFVEKDIEADATAAREMKSKLTRAGLRGGSIPVLDVRGRVMIGFNPREVDEALGQAL
jgi:glutaredoxin